MVVHDDNNFWSSKPSEHRHSQDFIVFRLSAPLCRIAEVQVEAYRALFQPGCAPAPPGERAAAVLPPRRLCWLHSAPHGDLPPAVLHADRIYQNIWTHVLAVAWLAVAQARGLLLSVRAIRVQVASVPRKGGRDRGGAQPVQPAAAGPAAAHGGWQCDAAVPVAVWTLVLRRRCVAWSVRVLVVALAAIA